MRIPDNMGIILTYKKWDGNQFAGVWGAVVKFF
jgi:hypothetical protein